MRFHCVTAYLTFLMHTVADTLIEDHRNKKKMVLVFQFFKTHACVRYKFFTDFFTNIGTTDFLLNISELEIYDPKAILFLILLWTDFCLGYPSDQVGPLNARLSARRNYLYSYCALVISFLHGIRNYSCFLCMLVVLHLSLAYLCQVFWIFIWIIFVFPKNKNLIGR